MIFRRNIEHLQVGKLPVHAEQGTNRPELELLELLEQAVLVEEVDKAVEETASGGQQAIALAALEGGQHDGAELEAWKERFRIANCANLTIDNRIGDGLVWDPGKKAE